MIYSVSNSNLLIIWGRNFAINKTYLIMRLLILRTVASILIEKMFIITFAFNQMFIEWRHACVEVFFNFDVEGSDSISDVNIMAF